MQSCSHTAQNPVRQSTNQHISTLTPYSLLLTRPSLSLVSRHSSLKGFSLKKSGVYECALLIS